MRRNINGTIYKYPLAIILAVGFFLFLRFTAEALNQASNNDFSANADGWTAVNGTGTDSCGATSTTAETDMGVFAYDGSGGNPAGSFAAITGSTANGNYRGKITQSFVATGTGAVAVTGKFDYFASGANWSASDTSWIRLDIYDSGDSTYEGNLGCVTLNSDKAWTSLALSNPVTLTGGTTYTIRATLRSENADATSSNTLAIDNIIVDVAPAVSISVSDGHVDFGTLALGASSTNASDVQVVTVENGPSDLDIRSTAFSDGQNSWALGASNGNEQVKWEFSQDQSAWTAFTAEDQLYGFDTNVPTSDTRNLYLRLTMPTATDYFNQSSSTVTIVASAP